jgi:valyl-tRNA synthetase
LAKEGLSKQKLGREKWLERAWKFKDEIYKIFHETWTVFGISADWSREVFTLEPKVQQAVLEEFKSFWEQDLLYKGAYIVSWCPKCGTAIEDVEVEYEEKKEKLYFIRYEIAEHSGEHITLATARPETIYADSGIAIYPNHPKYSRYIGKHALNPLNEQHLPIFEDTRVDKDFGTGALKITPGHDPLDYEIGKEHSLPIHHAIDKTGRMTDLAGSLSGLKINEAREKAETKLQELGAIEKIEEYTHSVPACERCKTTVEPLISEEWFVKMKPLAQKALENIDKIKFHPSNYNKILKDWIENIHDWSISRSLWWGHRIPVWYCQKCNPNHEVGKDKDMVISLEEPGKNCQTCRQKHWIQDEQVLDTWFSSGLWPMATLGWPENSKELERYYPWDFETSAGEIKYLWIARMIMLGLWFKNDIPFKNQFFHGMLRDLQGRKFSKSLGNGIDANELREQWGTDSTRMALYTYSAPGRDGRANKQTMDERAKNFRNFGNKIINIAKFVIDLKPTERRPELDSGPIQKNHEDDKWILEELEKTTKQVTKNIEEFQLHLATDALYEFIWHKFADIYIEKTKNRREEAQPCLEYILDCSLRLLHPFMPFLTEELWQKMGNKESIMLTPWPKK